jgi:hypothetical protein
MWSKREKIRKQNRQIHEHAISKNVIAYDDFLKNNMMNFLMKNET